MAELVHQALGTLLLRPYVFAFLGVHLLAASRDLGGRRALAFTGWAWGVAFIAEYSSTRTGIPFGLYHYTQATQQHELYLANVPVMDPLSFAFLAYAAFATARLALRRSGGLGVVMLSGLLMMLLDVVIDPLAVRGDRWFLGRIFYYPEGGVYFGVPLSNFLGWAVVGWAIVGGHSWFARPDVPRSSPLMGAALYYGVLVFNLAVTWWIGEPLLLSVGLLVHTAAAGALGYCAAGCLPRATAGPAALGSPIGSRAAGGLPRGTAEPAALGSPCGSRAAGGLPRGTAGPATLRKGA